VPPCRAVKPYSIERGDVDGKGGTAQRIARDVAREEGVRSGLAGSVEGGRNNAVGTGAVEEVEFKGVANYSGQRGGLEGKRFVRAHRDEVRDGIGSSRKAEDSDELMKHDDVLLRLSPRLEGRGW